MKGTYMKSKLVVSALIAAMLAAQGGAAFADDHDHDRGRGHAYGHDRHGPPRGHYDNRYHDRGPGAGPHHEFHRGDRLAAEYRHRQYVVDNWRLHHLAPPPRGYHWVQTGPDYVLVAITSGIIAQIVIGN
jgi:Ni/Co efflux regulator RcnB